MFLNNKKYFKYILNGFTFSFINNLAQKSKTTNLVINNDSLLYLSTHFKLASIFYSTHLSDIFAYETPNHNFTNSSDLNSSNFFNKSQSSLVVYNFHSLYLQDRFFIFVSNNIFTAKSKILSTNHSVDSIAELFPAANWLEREVLELHGVNFSGKKDVRNLMLQYGDSSIPFQKSFPTIGLKEMFYEPVKDTLIQNPVTVQL